MEEPVRVFAGERPDQSARADQETAAIQRVEGLQERHKLETRIVRLETTVKHLATSADLQKAKTWMIMTAISMAVSMAAALAAVIAVVTRLI